MTERQTQELQTTRDNSRKNASTYEEIYRNLQDLPDHDVQHVLQRIRSGADPVALLNHTKSANLLLQLALTPETRLRYEFPYIREMPLSLLTENPYLDCLIFEAASLYSEPQQQQRTSSQRHVASIPHNREPLDYQSPYLKPLHAAEVVDPRLSAAKPSMWTTVSSNDVLMRQLLSYFFRCEYSFECLFQKNLFLEDLVSGKTRFCSSLLVNAILAYACVRFFLILSSGNRIPF